MGLRDRKVPSMASRFWKEQLDEWCWRMEEEHIRNAMGEEIQVGVCLIWDSSETVKWRSTTGIQLCASSSLKKILEENTENIKGIWNYEEGEIVNDRGSKIQIRSDYEQEWSHKEDQDQTEFQHLKDRWCVRGFQRELTWNWWKTRRKIGRMYNCGIQEKRIFLAGGNWWEIA